MADRLKECPNCGRRFEPNWNTRKYCGEECAREYRNERRRLAHRLRDRMVAR